jgi:hypothetical protein
LSIPSTLIPISLLWKKSNDEEALKCWNFELALEAELENKPVPKMLTMNDISGEEI